VPDLSTILSAVIDVRHRCIAESPRRVNGDRGLRLPGQRQRLVSDLIRGFGLANAREKSSNQTVGGASFDKNRNAPPMDRAPVNGSPCGVAGRTHQVALATSAESTIFRDEVPLITKYVFRRQDRGASDGPHRRSLRTNRSPIRARIIDIVAKYVLAAIRPKISPNRTSVVEDAAINGAGHVLAGAALGITDQRAEELGLQGLALFLEPGSPRFLAMNFRRLFTEI